MLHDNRELFWQAIIATADHFGIHSAIVEKDYYVTMFLKALVEKQPEIVFKGGTSLSKCYKQIQRFSEDIDLSLEGNTHPTAGERKQLKDSIVSVADEFGFALTNADAVRSRRDYNKYIFDFDTVFEADELKQFLIVEMSVFLRVYPNQKMEASCFIYDYLKQEKRDDMITQYSMAPFELNVQSMERTFIDKLFALGDYYLDGKITEHSRHIYDLYKLNEVIEVNDELKKLFRQVREDRQGHTACLSAQREVDLKQLLQEIINRSVYRLDYERITSALLFEKVPYDQAISALQRIIHSSLLDQ